jgi:hypothetical protein
MSGGGGGKSDNTVKDTPEQRYAAKVAAEKWNFAQETLAPLEDQYMANVEDMDSEGRMAYIRGRSNQSSMAGLSQGLRQVDQQLGQAGINPNSGRWQGTQSDLAERGAQQGGETMGRAQFQQSSEKIRGMQNIVAMGAGESAQAQAGLSDIASTSARDARGDASNSFNRRSANLQLLGAAAGAAASYGMSGGLSGLKGGAADTAMGQSYANATGSFNTSHGTAAPMSWQMGLQ